MTPGIGLMKRRLEKEQDAISLATSAISKKYNQVPTALQTLETKYHADSGDWYVALGWSDKRAIVQMDSVKATIINISEI